MPEFSVIIPTWNRRALLLEAIASVRAQQFPDWELVVVDDGSDDGSAEAAAALAEPRLRLLRRPHTGDVADARNAGAAAARGRWLAFLDSDDLWEPGKLERQRQALLAGGARWSCTAYQLIDAHGMPLPFRGGSATVRSGRILADLVAMTVNVTICTVAVERTLFQELGGFRADAGREDYDFLLRLAAREPVAAVAESLARVREHPGRGSHSLPSPHLASLRVYQRFLDREQDPALRRLARRHGARLLLDGARYERARGRPARACRLVARAVAWAAAGGV